jgi:hypothetical protein
MTAICHSRPENVHFMAMPATRYVDRQRKNGQTNIPVNLYSVQIFPVA